MARPKSYDRRQAIERACLAFWEHGYSALGVRALEGLCGLNKFAIRSAFSGKEGLLLAALEYYTEAAGDSVLRPLESGGIDAIDGFFQGLVTDGSPNSSRWGCLIVNTGIENAELGRPALKAAVDRYWTTLEELFEAALRRSLDRGETVGPEDPGEAARGLVTAVMGIHAMNRASGAHDGGRPLVGLVRQLIAGWKP